MLTPIDHVEPEPLPARGPGSDTLTHAEETDLRLRARPGAPAGAHVTPLIRIGPSFEGTPFVSARKAAIRGIVLHWTAGIGDHDRVYRTLLSRRCSIHYTIAVGGRIYRMAPDALRCRHAGKVNDWTIGIEVVCPGLPGLVRDKEIARGTERRHYPDRLRGRTLETVDYTLEQHLAIQDLCEALCAEHGIPRAVPLEPDGSLVRREMTDQELASFAGVLGHYHCHKSKRDPGGAPLERLRQLWAPATVPA